MPWHQLRRDAALVGPAVRAALSAQLLPPATPWNNLRLALELRHWGVSPALGWAAGSARHSRKPAVIDPGGPTWSFHEAEAFTKDVAQVLYESGLGPGTTAAVLGRNSSGLALAIAAVSRTGADLVYLNPGFTEPQIAEIVNDRGVRLVLADDALLARVPSGVATRDLSQLAGLKPLATSHLPSSPAGRHIILTSGTTGTPKGADRSRTPLEAVVSLLAALPYRQRATHVLAAPMFHSWGWLNHRLSALLDATQVMLGRASAADVLSAVVAYGAEIVITTPVVIGRLAESGPEGRDTSALRGVLVSGAPLPCDVVTSFLDQFGPVLYNVYGSTEAGPATCASPTDLAADPTTAGRPMPGVDVKILDSSGQPVPAGEPGEVWVGSSVSFDGYIDGSDRDRRGGLIQIGDVGVVDRAGRLAILGRVDDLIISGGENLHPSEVESALRAHPNVADVAVVGVPDPTYGQVAVAHVVPATAQADSTNFSDDLREWSRTRLAPYQVPRRIVIRATIPRNETGKVQRRLL